MSVAEVASAQITAEVERRYRQRTGRSRSMYEQSLKSLPGGNTRTQVFFPPYPTFMRAGAGCYLEDVDGNRYLDLLNNYSSLIHGHAHPAVVRAVADQAAASGAMGAPTEMEIELAQVIRERIPSAEFVRFCNSGTEAVMNTIRAARAFTGRVKILKIEGGYHGTHDAVRVSVHPALEPPTWPTGVPDEAGLSPALTGEVLVTPFNDVETFQRIFSQHGRDVAAVMVEPMMGAAGMIPADRPFLQAIREATAAAGALLIFDEVLTFRLAWGGLQADYGIRPDLTALGKIIGGGLPVGAFGGRRDIMAVFDPRQPHSIEHPGTYNGNPLTMAAGLATLRCFQEPDIDRVNGLGERLRVGLRHVLQELRVAGQVTGLGSLAQVHFTAERVTDYRSARRASQAIWSTLHLALMIGGLVMAPRGMFAVSTPMTEREIDLALDGFKNALLLTNGGQ